MATLADYLTAQIMRDNAQDGKIISQAEAQVKQRSMLKSIKTSKTDAETYTTLVNQTAWETLYDIAVNLGQQLKRSFWENLEFELKMTSEVAVCFKGKHIMELKQVTRDKMFAKHLGEMLKRGYSIVIVGRLSTTIVVDWDNWKWVYQRLTSVSEMPREDWGPSRKEMRQTREALRKERDFYELAKPIRSKKGGRTRISFEEARDQRVKMERVNYESQVYRSAKKILAVL